MYCGVLYRIITIITITNTVKSNILDATLMKNVAKEFGNDLEILKNNELGAKFVDELFDNFKYTPVIVNANKTIDEMASKLEMKINEIFSTLSRAKNAIQNMQTLDNSTKTKSSLVPCADTKNAATNKKISKMCGEFIDMILYRTSKDQLRVDYVLQKLKSNTWNFKTSIKQQYFISSWDVESFSYSPFLECDEIEHKSLWNNYISRNNYDKKNIVLLLDHGGSLSKLHLNIVKNFAKQLIETLNEKDNIAIIGVSNELIYPQFNRECSNKNMDESPNFFAATKINKQLLNKFVDNLQKGTGITNHTTGIEHALKFIKSQKNVMQTMVLYVSRGLLSSLTEVTTILKIVDNFTRTFNGSFYINTCAIVDESRPTIYETQFLEDLALQNFVKYNISTELKPIVGTMIIVNSTENIGFALSRFYNNYNVNSTYNLNQRISLPIWDYKSNDLTVSFSMGIYNNEQFGLLGMDVYFSNLIQELTYFNNQKYNYVFLIDMKGRVILHPSFPCPLSVKQQLHYGDIKNFETAPDFDVVRKLILEKSQGFYLLDTGSPTKYTWKHIGKWFIICFVESVHQLDIVRPFKIPWPFNESNNIKLIYHHLDDTNICRHHNQIATLDAGSLYLSITCLHHTNVTNSNFLSSFQEGDNAGLSDEIRDDIAALAYILEYLRKQHLSSVNSKFIVRRYVTSYNGVLEMFPGSVMVQGFEPTKRSWFHQAVSHKGKIILTPPYLDEGGAGYIVTISLGTPNVVLSLDVTYGYVFKLILDKMDFCSTDNITCFLMDDRGYLVYHPNLIDPNGHGPVEKQHIVHKESLVANDILNNKNFIQKLLCNSYGSGTVQRYYKLNTSYNGVLTNLVHCVSYYILPVPMTNLFFGVVNVTCNLIATFCPCSIIDRLCLNCNRMEQTECECPCECPIDDCLKTNLTNNPLCGWFPEHSALKTEFVGEPDKDMKSCFSNTCSSEKGYYDCLGVTGCEWCKYDVDGSILENPFCASLATCFNGVVGSLSPYKNFNVDVPNNETLHVPVGLILIFILAIIVVVLMVYFCYRSTSNSNVERLYLSSTQDNHLRMSDLNLNDNYNDLGNHRDKLLQDSKPNPVSPYCVTSNYRRTGPPTADSDHGYSTMTQHDESEHLSLAPVEIDSLEDDLTSDTTSIHTSLSNKPHDLQFTNIPMKNCIVVPVTVHRNMEMT